MAGNPSDSESAQPGGRRGGRPPNPGTKWWDDLRDIDVSRLDDSPSAAWDDGQSDIPGWETAPDSAAGHIWGRGRARSADRDEPRHNTPGGGPEPMPRPEPPRYEPPRHEPPRYEPPRPEPPRPEPPRPEPPRPEPPRPEPPRREPNRYQQPRYEDPGQQGPRPPVTPPPPAPREAPRRRPVSSDPYPPAEPAPRHGRGHRRPPEGDPYQPPQPGGAHVPGWGTPPAGVGDSTAEFPAAAPPTTPPGRPPTTPSTAAGTGRSQGASPRSASRPPAPEPPSQPPAPGRPDGGERRRRRRAEPAATAPPAASDHTADLPPVRAAGPERPAAGERTPSRRGSRQDAGDPSARPGKRAVRGPGRVDPAAIAAFSNVRSGFAALFAGGLAILLIFGSRLDQAPYAAVCFAVQALFVVAWTFGGKPPGPEVVAGVGILAAVAADLVAVYAPQASLAPLGYVVAAGFVLGVVGQLVRGGERSRVTESIGAVAVVTVAVVALATPILLSRYPAGGEALFICLLAVGVGLAVARVSDLVLHEPRVSPQVPRGAPGVVIGAMTGTAVAGWAGSVVVPLTPGIAAVAGVVVAVAAVLADLGMVFAETGRLLAGEEPSRWMVRAMLGPLVAFAVAAPAAYLLSVLMIVKDF